MNTSTRTIRAPRGATLSCKGWPQEAALRMVMNNLDPEVAERPDDLVVYGGSGRAARSWAAYDAIVATLRRLEHDETLVVQSGKPVAVFRTHPWAPRVLIANALLVPVWATWDRVARSVALEGNAADVLPALVDRGITPDVLTDQTSAHDALNGYVPAGLTV